MWYLCRLQQEKRWAFWTKRTGTVLSTLLVWFFYPFAAAGNIIASACYAILTVQVLCVKLSFIKLRLFLSKFRKQSDPLKRREERRHFIRTVYWWVSAWLDKDLAEYYNTGCLAAMTTSRVRISQWEMVVIGQTLAQSRESPVSSSLRSTPFPEEWEVNCLLSDNTLKTRIAICCNWRKVMITMTLMLRISRYQL